MDAGSTGTWEGAPGGCLEPGCGLGCLGIPVGARTSEFSDFREVTQTLWACFLISKMATVTEPTA